MMWSWKKKNNTPKDTDTDNRHGRVGVVFPYNILQQLNNINNLSENDVFSDEGRFSLKDTGVEVFEYENGNDADRIEKVNVAAEEKGVKFSLKNENITIDTKIPYVHIASYVSVRKGDRKALDELRIKVKNLKRGTYENRATGY